jgi:hypothetical protein
LIRPRGQLPPGPVRLRRVRAGQVGTQAVEVRRGRGDVPLDPEDLEPTLRRQYDLQVRLLSSLGLREADGAEGRITALDGRRYPLPAFDDVLARIQTPELRRKLEQGFDTLLLPFGVPLYRFFGAWRRGLRRNEATLRSLGSFNQDNTLWVLDPFSTEPLVYEPQRFTDNHGGGTKEDLLAADHRGWDVLLVEGSLANLPHEGRGQTIGDRPQLECGRTPAHYLRVLPRGEIGLTPEAYIIQFLDALERRRQVLDVQTISYLPGAYLPASRCVPGAYWEPSFGMAHLDADEPVRRDTILGVRAAVRVG